MAKLTLKAQNGEILFSNENWCRVSIMVNKQKIDYGCEERYCLYQKFLSALSNNFRIDSLVEIIFGEPFRYLCGLSEPHTSISISCNENGYKKILFIPDEARFSAYIDKKGRKCCEFNRIESKAEPFVLVLSEKDCITWQKVLSWEKYH